MIVEERDDTTKPAKAGLFVETDREHGLPIQREYLGTFHRCFASEIGALNRIVAWWSCANLKDRQARRARMLAGPRRQAFLDKLVDRSRLRANRILLPTAFSRLR